jgi:hypothetical protein
MELEIEERSLTPAPDERTEVQTIKDSHLSFEMKNKLRSSKGFIVKKDQPTVPAAQKQTDKHVAGDKPAGKEVYKN